MTERTWRELASLSPPLFQARCSASIVRSPAPVKSRQEDHLYSKLLQNCGVFIHLSCRDFTGAGDWIIEDRAIFPTIRIRSFPSNHKFHPELTSFPRTLLRFPVRLETHNISNPPIFLENCVHTIVYIVYRESTGLFFLFFL